MNIGYLKIITKKNVYSDKKSNILEEKEKLNAET